MTITAKIIADSISPDNIRLTTLQLRYPRFIHSEFMTHRLFSRNASSSRAVPVAKLIEDILQDTAMPIFWGKNQPGMQAREECNEDVCWRSDCPCYANIGKREEAWFVARDRAIESAKEFHNAGYHKQIVNRLLEPFSHINVVCTATQWSNFFKLRDHEDAQPEIRELAVQMKNAMRYSEPVKLEYGQWHLPYVKEEEIIEYSEKGVIEGSIFDELIKLSVARCARVSYLTHDQKEPNVKADLKLYDRLLGSQPIHASPAEHQATPDQKMTFGTIDKWYNSHQHGNFEGWIQFRKTLKNECQ